MIARRGVLGLLGATVAISLTGCGAYSGESYRFRMTVEAETPQGVVTGSSVYEVTAKKLVRLTSEERAGSGGTRGQALILDLPSGPVFVTLKMPVAGHHLGIRATKALLPATRSGDIDANLAAVDKLGSWFADYKAELPREDWPLMVRFGDINDPSSVERVEPGSRGIKRIFLETTSDDVSVGIEKKLAWLRDAWRRLDHRGGVDFSGNSSLAKQVTHGDFSTELPK